MKFMKLIITVILLTVSNSAFSQTHADSVAIKNTVSEDTLPSAEEDARELMKQINAIDSVPTRESMEAVFSNPIRLLERESCSQRAQGYTRRRAISLLSMFGDEGRKSLMRLSQCKISETGERAIYTLARTFPNNEKVIKMVINFDHLKSKTRAFWTVRALRWISPKIARPKLIELQRTQNVEISKIAKRLLEK